MSWTLTVSGAAVTKAGVNAPTALLNDDTALSRLSTDAEGAMTAEAGYDFVANYSLFSTNGKTALSEANSTLIAFYIVHNNLSAYPGGEGRTMLDALSDRYNKMMTKLKKADDRRPLLS